MIYDLIIFILLQIHNLHTSFREKLERKEQIWDNLGGKLNREKIEVNLPVCSFTPGGLLPCPCREVQLTLPLPLVFPSGVVQQP